MQTLMTANIPDEQIQDLEVYAATHAGPEMSDLLQSLSRLIREGAELTAGDPEETFTPTEVAGRLGMSRTHLYKLLDRGEIPSHRVGRDRRIRFEDLADFETRRQNDRRELAERFAMQQQTREAAIDEIADLL